MTCERCGGRMHVTKVRLVHGALTYRRYRCKGCGARKTEYSGTKRALGLRRRGLYLKPAS